MIVYFNNEATVLSRVVNLHKLLHQKTIASQKGIAVAVNNKVVKRSDWENYLLNENDKVLVIGATRGG